MGTDAPGSDVPAMQSPVAQLQAARSPHATA